MTRGNEPPSDVVLAHYGVKGMKWGKRKANPVREAKRERNRVTKETGKQLTTERDQKILDARERIENSNANLKNAKKQYKTDRKEVGRQAAKASLISARTKEIPTLMRDSETAMMMTAREQQEAVMAEIGGALIRVAFAAATGR